VKISTDSKFLFWELNVSFDVPVNATTSSFSSRKIPIFSSKAPTISSELGIAILTCNL